ncbi:hypothetical protein AAF712_007185 [Marasmius tenuissimus]|uniref:Uncharacterized protein n=1 Tax=Marasmius tenuissimus TaxID=585030 RepID=A0ABR2ZXR6_9AGAR
MLKCLGDLEHEVGGFILDMPETDTARAVFTFETGNKLDRNVYAYKPFTPRPTRIVHYPPKEVEFITTYRLWRGEWEPEDLVDLLRVDLERNNTEKDFAHPHIPDRESTRYTYVYSIDFANPPPLIDFGVVPQLVSGHREQPRRTMSLVDSCSFSVAAVFKVMQTYFNESEPRFNEDICSFPAYPSGVLLPPHTCVSNDSTSQWFRIGHSPSGWIGSAEMDKFRILNVDHHEFKRIVEDMIARSSDALDAHPVRCNQRNREGERKKNQEWDKRMIGNWEPSNHEMALFPECWSSFGCSPVIVCLCLLASRINIFRLVATLVGLFRVC